jgi:transcriptional regulator with XRE-family HTH domain
MVIDSDFAKWLTHEINRRHLTGRKAAAIIGVSHQALTKWIMGTSQPTDDSLDGISKLTGVDRRFLYGLLGRLETVKEEQVTERELRFLRLLRELRPDELERLEAVAVALRGQPGQKVE